MWVECSLQLVQRASQSIPGLYTPGSREFRAVAGALLRAHILNSSLHTACEDLTSHVKLGLNPLLSWCVHIYKILVNCNLHNSVIVSG